MMSLTERYSRIPYLEKGRTKYGVDCYGLLYLVYYQELGIKLPLLTSKYVCANKVSYRNVARNKGFFVDWEEVEKPKKFDVGLFELAGYTHVGICVDDKGRAMMHISNGGYVKVDKIKSIEFKDVNRGWYRYIRSPDAPAPV